MPKTVSARSPSITSHESYKAVIIADLVAEVPEEVEKKEETKFDAVVNGSDLSKGIILNAVQIEDKLKGDAGKIALPASFTPQNGNQKEKLKTFKEEFLEMSFLRKIAFGASFLPSIMFVLCFSIIFPCEKILPCLQVQWVHPIMQTEITSTLHLSQNTALITSWVEKETGAGIRSRNLLSGKEAWEHQLNSPIKFVECGLLAAQHDQSCILMDQNGTMQLIDSSNGTLLWEVQVSEYASNPILLPDCNNYGVDQIAVAVSKSKLRVTYDGKIVSMVELFGCDSIPSRLLTWKKQSGADILFICQKGENEFLGKLPQNKWCIYDQKNDEKASILISTKQGLLTQAKFLSTPGGFYVWLEKELKKINQNGSLEWTVSNFNHSIKNRFIIYGKLNEAQPQVILYSSDIENGFQVTILDTENGNITNSITIPDTEVTEVILIHGMKRDFILNNKIKISKSLKSQAITKLNLVSSILLSEEEDGNFFSENRSMVEEITLQELDGTEIQTIDSFYYSEGESYPSAISATSNDKDLNVYILRKLCKEPTVKKISVNNWDRSSDKVSHCTWK